MGCFLVIRVTFVFLSVYEMIAVVMLFDSER